MVTISVFFDIGAQSILIPYVQNADEAKKTRSPTRAIRPRACARRRRGPGDAFARVKDYAKRAHEELCVLVQVETQQALDNLEKIAAVKAWTAYSSARPICTPRSATRTKSSHAHHRRRPHPPHQERGQGAGILTGVEADARHWIECGGLFVAVGPDHRRARARDRKPRQSKS